MEPELCYTCLDCGAVYDCIEECMACECLPIDDNDPELPAVQDGGDVGGLPEFPW